MVRLPVSELVMSLKRCGETYQARLLATAPGEREARALAALLRIARGAVKADAPEPRRRFAGRVLNSDVSVSGNLLTIVADGLSAEDIASLLPDADSALLYP
jgi:hypothetical protein